MQKLRNLIIKCLYDNADDDNQLIEELQRLIKTEGRSVYPLIFHILTHLDLDTDKAEGYWQDVIAHKRYLSQAIGRDVKLRTAICDYFCSVNKNLINPVVVEIYVFEANAHIAKYDNLTGLFNRHYFDEAYNREMARAKRHKHDLSLLFLDIDNFKKVNDTFGHLGGDLTLKHVASVIKAELRAEDIAARYGGEEIVVILPETSKAKAYIVGERIRRHIAASGVEYEQHRICVTISGGLASFPIDADEQVALLNHADLALYRAKQNGKNMLSFHSFEKRRFIRIHFNSGVALRKIGMGDVREITGNLKNMSLNGILVETETPIEISSLVQLRIPMPPPQSALVMMGTVVRVEIFSPNRYEIGVSFIEIDDITQQELSRMIMEL